jgi:hypothetical protein
MRALQVTENTGRTDYTEETKSTMNTDYYSKKKWITRVLGDHKING